MEGGRELLFFFYGKLFLSWELAGSPHSALGSSWCVCAGCSVPHSDACAEDALDDRSVELGEDLRGHIHLAEWSEEVHPLMSSLSDG